LRRPSACSDLPARMAGNPGTRQHGGRPHQAGVSERDASPLSSRARGGRAPGCRASALPRAIRRRSDPARSLSPTDISSTAAWTCPTARLLASRRSSRDQRRPPAIALPVTGIGVSRSPRPGVPAPSMTEEPRRPWSPRCCLPTQGPTQSALAPMPPRPASPTRRAGVAGSRLCPRNAALFGSSPAWHPRPSR